MNPEQTEVTLKLTSNFDSCVIINNSGGMKRGDEACKIVLAKTEHTLGGELENLHLQNEYQSQVKAKNIIEFNESEMEAKAVTIPSDINCHQQSDFESSNIGENDAEGNIEKIVESKVINPEPKCLFEDRYNVLEEIGKGRYGVVRKIIDKSTGIHLAAKFVRTIKTKDRQQVLEEINVMNKLRHPKLLRLIAAFESPRETIMVTEYISGGELFERVVADDFTLTEKDSILFVRQICEGVAYMHDEKIVHMDLKPENIMCQMRTSHRIKLIDFGLAQTLKPNTPVRVLFGTPEFISPEIIGFEPIGTESDMWSIGVICYVLLSGLSPFMGDNDAETFANITRADYDFDDKAFDAISQEAMDFISSLLIKRKELRMSAKDCLNHPWLAQCAENMSRVVLSTDKLKKFIVRRKWQKTGNAIRALGRMATLSANSRKNISSASPPNSDIFCEESVPEEIKNNYLLPEESSTLVATSLNNLEADENSGLEAPTQPETSETTVTPLNADSMESTVGDFTMDRAFESIDYEKCMIEGTEFTDDSTEESETTLDSCTQLKTASNDMIIENEDMTEIDLTAIRNIQTFNMNPENPTPSTDTLINTPSNQLNYKNSVDFRPIHEQVCETTQRQGNSKNYHHELDEQTINVEEILNPLRPNSIDFHERNDLFDEITDSQFKSDTLNTEFSQCSTDEKPEEREPTRVTTRTASLGRIVSTGSVTRTAKMFEQESIASQSRTPVNRIFLPTADARPQNERIRKAFAFWQN